jgi:hypothetical protein
MNTKRSIFHGGLVLKKNVKNTTRQKSGIRDGHSYQGARYSKHRNVLVSETAAYVTSVSDTLTRLTYWYHLGKWRCYEI